MSILYIPYNKYKCEYIRTHFILMPANANEPMAALETKKVDHRETTT